MGIGKLFAQSPCLTVVDPFLYGCTGCLPNQADANDQAHVNDQAYIDLLMVPDEWMGPNVGERLTRQNFPLDGRGFLLLGQSFLGSVQLIMTALSDVLVCSGRLVHLDVRCISHACKYVTSLRRMRRRLWTSVSVVDPKTSPRKRGHEQTRYPQLLAAVKLAMI
jgi:hypothetical protein